MFKSLFGDYRNFESESKERKFNDLLFQDEFYKKINDKMSNISIELVKLGPDITKYMSKRDEEQVFLLKIRLNHLATILKIYYLMYKFLYDRYDDKVKTKHVTDKYHMSPLTIVFTEDNIILKEGQNHTVGLYSLINSRIDGIYSEFKDEYVFELTNDIGYSYNCTLLNIVDLISESFDYSGENIEHYPIKHP